MKERFTVKWLWSKPRIVNAPSDVVWPKKVYFLDGPLKDTTRTSLACVRLIAERWLVGGSYNRPSYFTGDMVLPSQSNAIYVDIAYVWETLYPRAEVAYMRLENPVRPIPVQW